jgi:hypothetical protein
MNVSWLSTLAIFLVAGPVMAAEGPTGNTLYQLCANKTESAEMACEMWITGFTAGATKNAPTKIHSVCLPSRSTPAQARLVIEKFMREHPEVLQLPDAAVAYAALGQAFPCSAKNSN